MMRGLSSRELPRAVWRRKHLFFAGALGWVNYLFELPGHPHESSIGLETRRRSRDHVRNGTGVAIPPTLRELHVPFDSKVATLPYGSPGPDRVDCSDGYTSFCRGSG